MSYLQFDFEFDAGRLDPDILMAYLAEMGFESFTELDKGLSGFMRKGDFSEIVLRNLLNEELAAYALRYRMTEIEDRNWNALWESNFQAVVIAGRCLVRAPFHEPQPGIPMEIIIEPKMSFGTAHHETTALMMEMMFEEDFNGKRVLDMGCGTGILAVLAHKSGAAEILAIDNDEWAYRNSLENAGMNDAPGIEIQLGDATALPGKTFDIILANINRNILLADIAAYAEALAAGGVLLLSGFYLKDLEVITEEAGRRNLLPGRYLSRNDWIAARFIKK